MKHINAYQCEHCQALYETQYLAETCESNHKDRISNAKITGAGFANPDGTYGMGREYVTKVPKSIMVKFSEEHGDFGRYVLEHYGFRGV
jgi:hypothetical protein